MRPSHLPRSDSGLNMPCMPKLASSLAAAVPTGQALRPARARFAANAPATADSTDRQFFTRGFELRSGDGCFSAHPPPAGKDCAAAQH